MSAGQNPHSLPADFDVGAWLQRIGLGQYQAAFVENEINAVALPLLTEEDLKACGVTVLGHRKIILHEIQKVCAGAKAAESLATAQTMPASPPSQPKAPEPSAPVEMPTLRAGDKPAESEVLQTEIVIRENNVELFRRILDPGEYVIGRDPTAEFLLTDPLVSRRHAKLTISAGHWLIEDLGSRIGTALNGFPVQEPTHVLPSQTIELGPATVVLRRVTKAASDVTVLVAAPAAPAGRPRTVEKSPEKEVAPVVTTLAPPPRQKKPQAEPARPPVERSPAPQARQVQRSRNVWTKQKLGFWAKIAASKFLLVSIGVHFLFGVGAAVYVVQRYQARRKLTFQGGPPLVSVSKRVLEHKVSMAKKKNTMSAPAQAKRIATAGLSKVVLPEMPAMPEATEVMPKRMAGMGGMGMGPGFGSGGGMGTGVGTGVGTIALPRIVGDRCSAASRAAAMKAGGGDPKSEDAILKGLTFLKSQQNSDGSFGKNTKSAMTGLALLSFLGHCEKPTSPEYGDCVRKAIDYLVGIGAANNGKLTTSTGNGWAYEQGMAAYALGEAYIFTREEAIAPVLRAAIKLIVEGQGPDGGWVYGFTKSGDGDTSVSGWQIQALKVAHLSDLNIEGVDACMKKAVTQFLRVHGTKGGFGYRTKADMWRLTGVGVFCLQTITHQKGQPVISGLNFLQANDAPEIKYKSPDANLYAWYYNTQACFQAGGSNWGRWNRACQPELLANQGADGCWDETGSNAPGAEGGMHYTGTGSTSDAKVYRTSLCILMLEVYYRYLASNQ